MTTTNTTAGGLPSEVVADLLADDRRRRALERLDDDGTLTIETLARRLAAAETEPEPAEPPERLVEEIEAELWDDHVPKLTATGVVEYDSMRAAVSLAPATRLREEL